MGNGFFNVSAVTAFRMDRIAFGSCFGMLGFLAGAPGGHEATRETQWRGPFFPVGRIISTSSPEGKLLPIHPPLYC